MLLITIYCFQLLFNQPVFLKLLEVRPDIAKGLKVKGLDIYMPLLTGKPEQQQFTKCRTGQH